MKFSASALALLIAIPTACYGQALEELRKFDSVKRNDRIDPGKEINVYALHQIRAALAKYDRNKDGDLDETELRALRADFRKPPTEPKDLARVGSLQSEAERRGGIPLEELVSKQPPKTSACDEQRRLYVRRDKLDVSIYNNALDKKDAKGAAISFTDDRQTETQTAEINGVATYVLARSPCLQRPTDVGIFDAFVSGYAFAPWLAANGNLSSNRASEKSSLRAGVDAQVEVFSGGFFDNQYFTASPYYQTDFRGLARAYGASLSWEPYKLDWRLGGSYQQFSSWIDFFWQLKAEVDALKVEEVGLTNLKADTEYVWVGATVRAHMFLLPEWLNSRLYLIGTYQHYWDMASGMDIGLATAALGYNIVEDGSTSIAFEYQNGTDKKTLKTLDQYMVTLNYKL